MKRKGQAAMEFLMTYGWAILAAIIAIGVLAYFGIFNPGRLAGNQGVINAPFNMDAFQIDDVAAPGSDRIIMEITQNVGENINVGYTLTVTPKQGIASGTTFSCTAAPGGIWGSGVRQTFTCTASTGDGAWASGGTVSTDIQMTYTKTGSSLPQQSSGSVRGVSD